MPKYSGLPLAEVISRAIDEARTAGLDEGAQRESAISAVMRAEPDLSRGAAARLVRSLAGEPGA